MLDRLVLGYPVQSEDWWVGKISQDQLRYCCSTFPFFELLHSSV
ncbi:hypothetical protein SPAR95_1103 [Streptococcus pneumoniae SPAR95]|nr:hypothetical protein SPAR31_1309 [Streptococcus pneumoniae GA13494]EHE48211.1 hypothetical protein SPAR115_1237 [Streptococcus pneumoniae GA52306]EHZ21879.1 hypothetical protein SPAR33_1414 [Streptococcus pneumoniae GA13723]EJG61352.1 hypothetical protein AMCSP02_001256 [Streptococcus pneumoniae 2061617]EJG68696.1 hypothetical protein AMCSP10_001137 [Streptococcus pneumoniae 2081685]EJG80950.1 hypothetical protein SPAR95_1103 [Streptococcus pneumoniae SPAR95]EJG85592.1 hypothetical protein